MNALRLIVLATMTIPVRKASATTTLINDQPHTALKVLQSATVPTNTTSTATISASDGAAFLIDNSSNSGNGIEIYSANQNQEDTAFIRLVQAATSYNEPFIDIVGAFSKWDASGSQQGNTAALRILTANPSIEFLDWSTPGFCQGANPANCAGGGAQNINYGVGKFKVALSSDSLQVAIRKAADSGFSSRFEFRRVDNSTDNAAEFIFKGNTDNDDHNGDYIGFKSTDTLGSGPSGGSTIWTLPRFDGNPGQVLATDGNGILSWGQPGLNSTGRSSNTGKPTCDAGNKGTTWFTDGGGTTKDKYEVCASDGTSYAWRTLY